MKALFPVAAIVCVTQAVGAQTPLPPPPACAAPEHRQFDFWVGRWDVYPTANRQRLIAHSLIERLYGDCVIRENWMPLRGDGGGSLNSYQPATHEWRQVWMDSSNLLAEMSGRSENGAIVYLRRYEQEGRPALTRVTYSPEADGTVRQRGEQSSDGGQTWEPSFDLTYVRAAAQS